MAHRTNIRRLLAFSLLLTCTPTCPALTIFMDYSHDVATDNFFSLRPEAKAAVDAAAADVSNAISSTMTAVAPPTVDAITGVSGGSTTTVNWSYSYTNPSTGTTVSVPSPNVAADTVSIFVGMRELAGTTLGQGGSGSAGAGVGFLGFESTLVDSVNNAVTNSDLYMKRGAGPTIGSISSSLTLGATTAPFTLAFGLGVGNLWFDIDTDNNTAADSLATLDSFWHYDHTTSVVTGKNDLYTVALHEILHSIGYGASQSWNLLASGTTWLGANAIALNGGTGAGLVSSAGSHLTDSYMSQSIYDGTAQEVVMDPTITTGTRKVLTQMDLAILRDLNFTTVPEPGRGTLTFAALLLIMLRRRRRMA